MKEKEKNHIIDLLFALTLFGVFAVSALFVVIFGAGVYKNTTTSMEHNFTSRTAVSYVTEKLRQRDVIGAASLTTVNGIPSITLVKQYDSAIVSTYIYSDEGYLKEITVTGIAEPEPSMGQKIMELSNFNVREISKGIYYVSITDASGNRDSAYISTKCDQDLRGDAIAAPES